MGLEFGDGCVNAVGRQGVVQRAKEPEVNYLANCTSGYMLKCNCMCSCVRVGACARVGVCVYVRVVCAVRRVSNRLGSHSRH